MRLPSTFRLVQHVDGHYVTGQCVAMISVRMENYFNCFREPLGMGRRIAAPCRSIGVPREKAGRLDQAACGWCIAGRAGTV